MNHGDSNLLPQLPTILAHMFEGLAKDKNLVWHVRLFAKSAFGKGHADIES